MPATSRQESQISFSFSGSVRGAESGAEATQRLQFKLRSASTQAVAWRLNGELLTSNASDSVFWVPKPGNWTLEVKSGDERDRVNFEVQVAATRSIRKGFSIAQ